MEIDIKKKKKKQAGRGEKSWISYQEINIWEDLEKYEVYFLTNK